MARKMTTTMNVHLHEMPAVSHRVVVQDKNAGTYAYVDVADTDGIVTVALFARDPAHLRALADHLTTTADDLARAAAGLDA